MLGGEKPTEKGSSTRFGGYGIAVPVPPKTRFAPLNKIDKFFVYRKYVCETVPSTSSHNGCSEGRG